MSNEILSSSKYRLNVNSSAAERTASASFWKFGLHGLTTKAFFHFAPDSTAFSTHHSTLNRLPFSMHGRTNSYHSCRGSAPLNLYQIPCHFVDAAVTTGSSEKQLGVCCSFPYPVQLSLWDASNATVEVQVLFPGEQIVQCIHLRTVADVDSLVTTLHDVYQPPGGIKDNEKTFFYKRHLPHGAGEMNT